jgi:hypothetical protein
MTPNSLLIVLGDHGMTEDGNHGGSSKEETDTVIYAYLKSENKKFYSSDNKVKKVD